MRGLGFWRYQYGGQGQAHYDDGELLAYLDIANYASGVFSEQTDTSTFDRAAEVLSPNGPGMGNKAEAHAVAAWLNFAAGGVGWSEMIDTDGDAETGSLTALFDTDAPEAREWAIAILDRVRREAVPVGPEAFETLVPSDLLP